MDRGGDKTLLLSADEDDFEPELSDRGHQRREYGQYRDERSTNQEGHTDTYGQDYYDYDYDEWTSADQQDDRKDHYAMEGRGDNDKYYDDEDDYEPRKSNVNNPPPYSDDFPARKEQQAYSHNETSAYPNNAYGAHNYSYAPPTVPSYPVQQNQPQPTPYVQSYRDDTSVVNSPYWRDAPTPEMAAQPLYAGQYALGPRMPEEPFQDVPSYKCSSILVMLFCCLPLGIAGLVYTADAENLIIQRKYSEAKKVANKAKAMNIIGVVLGILIWILNGVLIYFRFRSIQARYEGHY
ncbi:uncharacterized protein LOC131952506 [Physella acuta]|uniref:uncharacterized protein LOC131952506 n=1 Tax=Physella acuta TaxID=109671 RepID=UPI0027DB5D1B|nr:uncharacterized protein LOC131952506 [Physella acuta]